MIMLFRFCCFIWSICRQPGQLGTGQLYCGGSEQHVSEDSDLYGKLSSV